MMAMGWGKQCRKEHEKPFKCFVVDSGSIQHMKWCFRFLSSWFFPIFPNCECGNSLINEKCNRNLGISNTFIQVCFNIVTALFMIYFTCTIQLNVVAMHSNQSLLLKM